VTIINQIKWAHQKGPPETREGGLAQERKTNIVKGLMGQRWHKRGRGRGRGEGEREGERDGERERENRY